MRRKAEDLSSIKQVLMNLVKDLDLDIKMLDYELMRFWHEFTNSKGMDKLTKYSKAKEFDKQRRMVITVSSSVIRNELQFSHDNIEKEFLKFVETKKQTEPKLQKALSLNGLVFK